MKNLGKIILFLIFIFPNVIYAGVVASVNSSSVTAGETVTLSLSISGEEIQNLDYDKIHFVGNYVPLEGKYFYNQEKLDREIAITKLNTAQFVMIHKRDPQFLPYIEEQLLKNDVPSDFKYLAIDRIGGGAFTGIGPDAQW